MKKVKVLELQKSCGKYEIITNKISREGSKSIKINYYG